MKAGTPLPEEGRPAEIFPGVSKENRRCHIGCRRRGSLFFMGTEGPDMDHQKKFSKKG